MRLNGTAARAPVVIGADGVNGVTAACPWAGVRRHAVAFEGNVSYVHAREERWRGRAVVDLGAIPGGYAWVFPKGDHLNVGVGGWKSVGPRLRSTSIARAPTTASGRAMEALRGYQLPMRRDGAPVGAGP